MSKLLLIFSSFVCILSLVIFSNGCGGNNVECMAGENDCEDYNGLEENQKVPLTYLDDYPEHKVNIVRNCNLARVYYDNIQRFQSLENIKTIVATAEQGEQLPQIYHPFQITEACTGAIVEILKPLH